MRPTTTIPPQLKVTINKKVATPHLYGFNGMEKDDEVKGSGNSYTTLFRQYDPRIGRWLSIDPKMTEMPWQSPYISMDGNPIVFMDPLGDKVKIGKLKKKKKRIDEPSELTTTVPMTPSEVEAGGNDPNIKYPMGDERAFKKVAVNEQASKEIEKIRKKNFKIDRYNEKVEKQNKKVNQKLYLFENPAFELGVDDKGFLVEGASKKGIANDFSRQIRTAINSSEVYEITETNMDNAVQWGSNKNVLFVNKGLLNNMNVTEMRKVLHLHLKTFNGSKDVIGDAAKIFLDDKKFGEIKSMRFKSFGIQYDYSDLNTPLYQGALINVLK